MSLAFSKIRPAPFTALLEAAGRAPLLRRIALAQRFAAESYAVYRGNELIYIAFFKRWRLRRVELALMIRPEAAKYMLPCFLDLRATLANLRKQHMLVFVHVSPFNQKGRRMAAAAGFTGGRFKNPEILIYKGGKSNGRNIRRRQERA